MRLLEYGKGNYWTGDKMVEHAIRTALPIFRYTFPGCQVLSAPGNAPNHSSFSEDALVVTPGAIHDTNRQFGSR